MSDIITDTPKKARRTRKRAPQSDAIANNDKLPVEDSKPALNPITNELRHFDDGVIPADIEVKRIDHRRFWNLYLTPGTKAYSNYTESAKQTWPYLTDGSASIQGYRMMHRANSVELIRRAINASGANVMRRIQQLAKIAVGEAERSIVSEKGKRTEQPTFSEQIKAIEVLNKIDGIHTLLGVEKENLSAEMRRLRGEMLRELRGARAKHNTDKQYDTQSAIVADAESIDVDTLANTQTDDSNDSTDSSESEAM